MAKDTGLLIERGVHYLVMLLTIALMVFGLLFSYYSIVKRDVNHDAELAAMKENESKDKKGAAKQLPDFIVDKIKPNELGQLKP